MPKNSRHNNDPQRFVKRWDSGETTDEYRKMLALIYLHHRMFGNGPTWAGIARTMNWWALDPDGEHPRNAWRRKIMAGGRYGVLWAPEKNSLRVDPSLISRCDEYLATHSPQPKEKVA